MGSAAEAADPAWLDLAYDAFALVRGAASAREAAETAERHASVGALRDVARALPGAESGDLLTALENSWRGRHRAWLDDVRSLAEAIDRSSTDTGSVDDDAGHDLGRVRGRLGSGA